jgi:hypothetical protein
MSVAKPLGRSNHDREWRFYDVRSRHPLVKLPIMHRLLLAPILPVLSAAAAEGNAAYFGGISFQLH